jgi:hypothetical protein
VEGVIVLCLKIRSYENSMKYQQLMEYRSVKVVRQCSSISANSTSTAALWLGVKVLKALRIFFLRLRLSACTTVHGLKESAS